MSTRSRKIYRKRVHTMLLTLVMMLSMVVVGAPAASAYMWPCASPASMSIKTYPLDESTRSIPAYRNSNLTNKVGTVYGTDQITILAAEGDVLYVKFPTGSASKEGWIKASHVSPANLNGSHSLAMKAGGGIPVYRYETGNQTIGSISKGDTVYLCYAGLDHETGRAQIIYPVSGSGGWKMGWCSFTDIGNNWFRACGGSQTINDGTYFVNVSNTHRMDGMGANENVHVWEKLNVPQQKVSISHQGNGIYHIQFQHNSTYLDQQYATQDSSTLLAHRGNGGTNQDWYIADLGNDRYGFFNVCSGLSLDVYCYRTGSNGADILAYAYNGQAVTLEKLDGGSTARTGSIQPQSSLTVLPTVNPLPQTSNGLHSPVPNGAKFNMKTDDKGWTGYHDINIGVSSQTPVYAICDGTAAFYQRNTDGLLRSYGNYIRFVSSDGQYEVRYAHLSNFKDMPTPLKTSAPYECSGYQDNGYVGTIKVAAGQTLGWIGQTGNASGVHLHIEIYKNGVRIDPTTLFPNLI